MSNNYVLFVDDELSILNSIERGIIDEEFRAYFFVSGEKAIEFVANNEISVIVTDMKMPGMNGLEVLKRVKEISPNTVRIVLSGYAHLSQILATLNAVGVFKYITKPWDCDEDFLLSIREAVDYYNLNRDKERNREETDVRSKMYKKMLDKSSASYNLVVRDINNIKVAKSIFDKKENLVLDNISNGEKINIGTYKKFKNISLNIFDKYMETIPTSIEKIDIEKLRDDILGKFKSSVNFQSDSDVVNHNHNHNHKHNNKFINFITMEILEQLFRDKNVTKVNVSFDAVAEFKINIECYDKEQKLKYDNDEKLILVLLAELMAKNKSRLILLENDKKGVVLSFFPME